MTTETTHAKSASTDIDLPEDVVFELLLEDRRRYALYYLSRKVGAVRLDELVERLAHREGTLRPDRLAEISLEFHHNHLRKLVDADVVRYDDDAGTVERTAAAGMLDPYLELAFGDGH